MDEKPAQPKPKPRYLGYRIALAAVVLMIVGILGLLPISIFSAARNVLAPPSESPVWITPQPESFEELQRDWNDLLLLELLSLDETQQLITLRVSGVHYCPTTACPYRDKVTLFSGDEAGEAAFGIVPPSESILIPGDQTIVISRIQLPIEGNLIHYPFDQYELRLGVWVEREQADNSFRRLTPQETRGHVHVLATSLIPRLRLQQPRDLTTDQPDVPAAPYNLIGDLRLHRPDYLKVLVPSVILLIAAAGAYAVFMRPFDQLIINAGALVLGVWGARALLLGSYPPDVTAVDTALTSVILFLLMAISFRAAHYLQKRSGIDRWPWQKPQPPADAPTPD